MKNSRKNPFIKIPEISFWQKNNQSSATLGITKTSIELICKYTPKIIRKALLKITYKTVLLLSRSLKLLNQLCFTEYLINGKEKFSRAKLRILFISKEKMDPYIENKFFCEKPKYREIGKIYIWNIKKEFRKISPDVDAIIIKSDMFYSRFFDKLGCIIIPEWISMTLDITKSIGNIYQNFSKSAKEDFRKVEVYDYSNELSQDLKKLKLFYDKMYLPYSQKKHGKSAICVNFLTMRWLFESGYRLMLIKQKSEYISGILFTLENKTFKPKFMGISEDKFPLLKQGLGAAIYYFSILWAKENGAKLIDFGGTKSFLNDGAFRYKKKWGCEIKRSDKLNFYNIFSLKVCSKRRGIRIFLINNPFICTKNNKFHEMFFNNGIMRVLLSFMMIGQ